MGFFVAFLVALAGLTFVIFVIVGSLEGHGPVEPLDDADMEEMDWDAARAGHYSSVFVSAGLTRRNRNRREMTESPDDPHQGTPADDIGLDPVSSSETDADEHHGMVFDDGLFGSPFDDDLSSGFDDFDSGFGDDWSSGGGGFDDW